MLDLRLYRAAFAPVLVALIIAAFSLHARPAPITTNLSADAFDGTAAARLVHTWAGDRSLADRSPGGAGDEALGAIVGGALRADRFSVSERSFSARTIAGKRTLRAIVGERTGASTHKIVVVAFRDGRRSDQGSLADSALLVELANVLGGRTLNRTIDLVSTSGREGSAGALDLAHNLGGPVDAVLLLGDTAATSTRRPWVVPYGAGAKLAPLDLERTLDVALRGETSSDPGAPGFFTDFARLSFPLTQGSQGPFLAEGVPAVQFGPGGERPDPGGFSTARLDRFGRATLRAVSALDGPRTVAAPYAYLVLKGQVLPAWTVRLLVAALLLPLLVAAVDGLARVNRRRERPTLWLRWAAAGIVPFLLAVLYLRFLHWAGLLHAVPPGPAGAGAIPVAGGGTAALVGTVVVLLIGWLGVRPLLLRAAGVRGKPGSPGSAGAVTALLAATGILVWLLNPFAAALLVLPLHLCLLAVAPEVRWSKPVKLGLVVLGFLPAAVVALIYAVQFGLGPLGLAWMGALQVAGGQVSLGWAVVWSLPLGAIVSAAIVVLRAEHVRERPSRPTTGPSVRGPGSYVGPGSLGGTESAIRR